MGAAFAAWIAFAGCLYLSFRLVSRLQIIYFLVIALGPSHCAAGLFPFHRGPEYDARKVVIVGAGRHAWRVAQAVQKNAWAGLYLVGYIPVSADPGSYQAIDAPQLGALDQIMDVIKSSAIDEPFIES